MLSAPTTRGPRIDDEQGVDLVRFHQLRGFDGERVGADDLRLARHHRSRSASRARRCSRRRACGAGRRRCRGRAGLPSASTMALMPRRLRLISTSVSLSDGVFAHARHFVAGCASRRGCAAAGGGRALPAGCERAKSSAVKPRASSSATASASPSASAAVVLAVGASASGQASAGTLASRCTSASRASDEPGRPVIAISGCPGA
jgi:hypothetical protein